MKSIKKPLIMLVACAALLSACGSSTPSTSSSSSEPGSSSEPAFTPTYLSFVDEGKLRIDLFNVDVNFSYGDTALSQAVNTVNLDANSNVSVNKNSEIEKYYVILFAESKTGHTVKYLTPEGSKLTEFIELGSFKNFFKNYYEGGRGYLAISTGEKAQWTKGLNEKFDAEVEAWTKL